MDISPQSSGVGNSVSIRIETGDCLDVLRNLPPCFRVNCCVTSPPYFGLRDYGHAGQIGLEATPAEYVSRLVEVFRAVRDRLEDDGTLWLNLGDSYGSAGGDIFSGFNERYDGTGKNGKQSALGASVSAIPARDTGLRPKNLLGIPWRVAFALQADGWYLRSDIIWHKPNPMPESVTDRPTKAHEYIFLLSKSPKYYYDAAAVSEASLEFEKTPNRPRVDPDARKGIAVPLVDGVTHCGVSGRRNRRSVWTVPSAPFAGAHFATFPPDLIEPCIKAGCPVGGTVLDPFGGAGTTGLVADRLQRNALLIELNPEYAEMARDRITNDAPLFAGYSY
jgi:DNA modification methylase